MKKKTCHYFHSISKPTLHETTNNLRTKAAQVVGIMYKLQYFFRYEIFRLLYFSLVHSHLSYCPIVYLVTFKTHLKPLQIMQNRALRILHKYLPSPSSYPGKMTTETLYLLVHILSISCLCNFSSLLFKIKYDRQMLPVYFQSIDMLGRKGELRHYETRHKDQHISSRFITERSRFSPRNMVTSAWRKFHTVCDDTKSFNIIRHELLNFFLVTFHH